MKKLVTPLLLLCIACGNQNESETAPSADSGQGQAIGMVWQAPDGWVEEAPTNPMRKAQFVLPKVAGDAEDATVVISHFPGEGGGTRANINRWISMFKNMGESHEERQQEANGLQQIVLDISGTYLFQPRPMGPTTVEKPGFRMLAAVVEVAGGSWFVKFVGPKATVDRWESSFDAFMASFKQG